MSSGLRIALVGATGTLGSEVLMVLEEDRLPVDELKLFATERSLGMDLDFKGDLLRVETGPPELRGLDLVIVCAPGSAALDIVRLALRAEVPCLDCSGSLIGSNDVPLVVSDLGPHDLVNSAPLISSPAGPALAWALVLSALQEEAGLERVVGTVMHSASSAGRQGVEALSGQTIALLNQQPVPESEVFPAQIAFDCLPHPAAADEAPAKDGMSVSEAGLVGTLRRLLGPDVGIAASSVQVPAFAGEATALAVTTERPLPVERAARVLDAATGIDLWEDGPGPSTRDSVGRDEVLVGRLRSDPSVPGEHRGLLLWLAADPARLAAVNIVKLARTRFSLG
jgi:aspartate-semialdehyde dehydrogenase